MRGKWGGGLDAAVETVAAQRGVVRDGVAEADVESAERGECERIGERGATGGKEVRGEDQREGDDLREIPGSKTSERESAHG